VARQDLIDARVAKLIDGFGRYVRAYDDGVPAAAADAAWAASDTLNAAAAPG
jgi:hypothetical protein